LIFSWRSSSPNRIGIEPSMFGLSIAQAQDGDLTTHHQSSNAATQHQRIPDVIRLSLRPSPGTNQQREKHDCGDYRERTENHSSVSSAGCENSAQYAHNSTDDAQDAATDSTNPPSLFRGPPSHHD